MIEAVNDVELPKVEPKQLRLGATPTHTTAPNTKLVPVMVKLTPEPAKPEEGLTEVIVGTTVGAVTENGMEFEGPAEGDGFVTTIGNVPTVARREIGMVACTKV